MSIKRIIIMSTFIFTTFLIVIINNGLAEETVKAPITSTPIPIIIQTKADTISKMKKARIKRDKELEEIKKKEEKKRKEKLKKEKLRKEKEEKLEKALNVDFLTMDPMQVVDTIGCLFTEEQERSNILASVSMAQFLLESGFGKSKLAINANNYFGMKVTAGSSEWQGKTYEITTKEEINGKLKKTKATFKVYDSMKDSIKDHTDYLLNAKIGNNFRYKGLAGEKNYKKAVKIIKNGGYATSSVYVKSICSVIEKYELTRFDVKG